MPDRVSPIERVRGHIDELFASGKPLPDILEDVARLGAQLLMQAALEAEVTEFRGRGRYARAASTSRLDEASMSCGATAIRAGQVPECHWPPRWRRAAGR